jgi:hypothetical protein
LNSPWEKLQLPLRRGGSSGRIAALGATLDFHHGLLTLQRIGSASRQIRSPLQEALTRQGDGKPLRVAGAAALWLAEIAVRAEMGSHQTVTIDGNGPGATGTGQTSEHGARIDAAAAKEQ